MRPHARKAIRLQFHLHGDFILHPRVARLQLPRAAFHAYDFLHVMANLVREDVGLRKLSRCAESLAQLVVKTQVDIDLLVSRAIEGPGRGFRTSASARLRVVSEQDQLGVPVGLARLLRQDLVPGSLCVVQNEGNELHQRLFLLVAGRIGLAHRR